MTGEDSSELPTDELTIDLEADCAEAAKLRGEIKALETKLETIDQRIIDGCFAKGATSHSIPGWKANIENKTTRTIIKEKLVARGVDVAVIDECTKVSVSDPFVKFYAIKAK